MATWFGQHSKFSLLLYISVLRFILHIWSKSGFRDSNSLSWIIWLISFNKLISKASWTALSIKYFGGFLSLILFLFDQQLSLNEEVIDKIPEREPLNYITTAVRLLPALYSVPQHALNLSFNPNAALTRSPPPILLQSGLHLPSLHSFLRSTLQFCSTSVLMPTSTTAQEFSPKCHFCVCLFSGAAPCRSTPPLCSFLS